MRSLCSLIGALALLMVLPATLPLLAQTTQSDGSGRDKNQPPPKGSEPQKNSAPSPQKPPATPTPVAVPYPIDFNKPAGVAVLGPSPTNAPADPLSSTFALAEQALENYQRTRIGVFDQLRTVDPCSTSVETRLGEVESAFNYYASLERDYDSLLASRYEAVTGSLRVSLDESRRLQRTLDDLKQTYLMLPTSPDPQIVTGRAALDQTIATLNLELEITRIRASAVEASANGPKLTTEDFTKPIEIEATALKTDLESTRGLIRVRCLTGAPK